MPAAWKDVTPTMGDFMIVLDRMVVQHGDDEALLMVAEVFGGLAIKRAMHGEYWAQRTFEVCKSLMNLAKRVSDDKSFNQSVRKALLRIERDVCMAADARAARPK